MRRVVIIGAGALAREVLDALNACAAAGDPVEMVGFVVDPQYSAAGTIINGRPVLGGFDWLSRHAREVEAVCAVGQPDVRRQLILAAQAAGVAFTNVIHPSAITSPWVTMGQGNMVLAGAALSCQVQMGHHVLVNFQVTVAHDVVLEDFVTVSPGVRLCGHVRVCRGAFVGAGATVIEKLTVGKWSLVGAGSAVVRNVPEGATVLGVPATAVHIRQEMPD